MAPSILKTLLVVIGDLLGGVLMISQIYLFFCVFPRQLPKPIAYKKSSSTANNIPCTPSHAVLLQMFFSYQLL